MLCHIFKYLFIYICIIIFFFLLFIYFVGWSFIISVYNRCPKNVLRSINLTVTLRDQLSPIN